MGHSIDDWGLPCLNLSMITQNCPSASYDCFSLGMTGTTKNSSNVLYLLKLQSMVSMSNACGVQHEQNDQLTTVQNQEKTIHDPDKHSLIAKGWFSD